MSAVAGAREEHPLDHGCGFGVGAREKAKDLSTALGVGAWLVRGTTDRAGAIGSKPSSMPGEICGSYVSSLVCV
jgi:hypothetical protein